MQLNESQLLELKRCELNMLRAFLQVCAALNLKYYLVGGTLLGAVRHGGFIPWDDDIDIGMPREDFDRFVKEGQPHLPQYYFIQTHRTDPEWPENFAKIRDNRTTFVESSMKTKNINHGVYIDIFPLDYYPENPILALSIEMRNKLYRAVINQSFTLPKENKESYIRKVGKKILATFMGLKYRDLSQVLDARETMMKSIAQSSRMKNYCGAWGKREIVQTEWFGNGRAITFEDIEAVAPKNYHEYLKNIYGNYMQLPPEEKRIAHHYVEAFALEDGYQ